MTRDSSCFSSPRPPSYQSTVLFSFSDISNNKSTNVSEEELEVEEARQMCFFRVGVGGSAEEGATAVIRAAAAPPTNRPGPTYNHHIRATTLCHTLVRQHCSLCVPNLGLQSFITYNLCATTLQDCSSGTDKRETRRGRRGGERAQIFPKSSATEAR